jgi:pSer/pThr/pTyr-binding forkhead associated (FHA) protein
VDRPGVSGRHCRLTRDDSGFLLEDLNSTNGTYFNGQLIKEPARVALAGDALIHLGSHALAAAQVLALFPPEPIPTLTLRGREMVIGRGSTCDKVIDLPMVSSRHARIFREGDRVLIEDLQSSNGTFVNGTAVKDPLPVNPGDEIALGSAKFILDTGSWRKEEATFVDLVEFASDQSLVPLAAEPAAATTPWSGAPAQSAGVAIDPWRLGALIAQAPLLALLCVAILRGSPAPLLFSVGLAAIWFGLSTALLGNVVDASVLAKGLTAAGAPTLLGRLLLLMAVCLAQCVVIWAVVAAATGWHAAAVPALGLLILSSAVGLALGLVILALHPGAMLTWASLAVAMLLLWLLGGQVLPLSRLPPVVPSFIPARWTFEGLLLLESDPESAIAAERDHAGAVRPQNATEFYFPIDSERMGSQADVLALLAMLIGLAGAAGFISWASRPGP